MTTFALDIWSHPEQWINVSDVCVALLYIIIRTEHRRCVYHFTGFIKTVTLFGAFDGEEFVLIASRAISDFLLSITNIANY